MDNLFTNIIYNIPGAIIILSFGLMFLAFGKKQLDKSKSTNLTNYSQYPTVNTYIFDWVNIGKQGKFAVKFLDENKNEVLGVMDTSYKVGRNHRKLKRNSVEKAYYWKGPDWLKSNRLDGQPIQYYVHFCDQDIYVPLQNSQKNGGVFMNILGVCLCILATIVLFFVS